MITQPDQFPPDRRADPRRLAEARVFDAIQASDRPGLAIYEWHVDTLIVHTGPGPVPDAGRDPEPGS